MTTTSVCPHCDRDIEAPFWHGHQMICDRRPRADIRRELLANVLWAHEGSWVDRSTVEDALRWEIGRRMDPEAVVTRDLRHLRRHGVTVDERDGSWEHQYRLRSAVHPLAILEGRA